MAAAILSSGHPIILIVGIASSTGTEGSVTALLRHAGFDDVREVTGADASALTDACREHAPTLILLVGPAADRPASMADAVAQARLPQPPVLVTIPDHADERSRLEALEAGIADILVRPVPRAELVIRIGNLIRQQQALAEAHEQAATLELLLEERTQRLQEAVDLLRAAERRLTDQLEASRAESRGKSELMATAAHELRTPLHAVIGFADLIRTEAYGPLGDPRYVEYSHDIHHAASHMLALVDGTLDLAKAESGLEMLEIRRVDVGRVVQDSVRMLNQMAANAGVRLDVTIPDQPLMIRTDPEKVRQVVLNLASNAVKFTPHGGRVTVEVAADAAQGAIIMVVRDTGIGMAAADIPTAMKPFRQIRQLDRAHPKGTGLGLPLTRRFIEMLGGEMSIASKPGRGTIVTVRLPVDPPAGNNCATQPEASVAAGR